MRDCERVSELHSPVVTPLHLVAACSTDSTEQHCSAGDTRYKRTFTNVYKVKRPRRNFIVNLFVIGWFEHTAMSRNDVIPIDKASRDISHTEIIEGVPLPHPVSVCDADVERAFNTLPPGFKMPPSRHTERQRHPKTWKHIQSKRKVQMKKVYNPEVVTACCNLQKTRMFQECGFAG